ncbi:MAG: zinc ribbon domain-containing protein [Ruminococcaceae bacterium]|nr:zinc ribbon domain-containing protein [Oscillospiraceae bacterium]
MFCSKCGSNIEQGAAFCSGCGAPVARSNMQQQNEQTSYGYQQYGQQQYTQPNVQQPQQQQYAQQQYVQQSQQQQYAQQQYTQQPYAQPMGWFKFLIYFALFFGAVLNVANGAMMIAGAHYSGDADAVYRAFDGLKELDIIMGILSIVLAVYGIYTRVRLAGFYKNGPSTILTMYSLSVLVNLIYYIGLTSILPDRVISMSDIDLSASLSMLASAIMMFINKSYFDKRKHLFVK